MSETTFTKLSAYISKMRMSHIYQPVMIRELLLRGGQASVEQIAAALLAHDRSQLEYYELRTKNMVGRVLANNGITEVQRNNCAITGYALIGADSVSPATRPPRLMPGLPKETTKADIFSLTAKTIASSRTRSE